MRHESDDATTGTVDPVTIPHRFPVRVYYEDTDFSGVVYHASYLRFLERGRTEFLRALGIEHKSMFADGGKDGFQFVVRSMAIDFARPALMDDALVVETGPADIGGASIDMAQRVLRRSDVLVTAKVRVAFVTRGKVRRLPQDLVARIRQAHGEVESASLVPKATQF
jgi:acyl-CoA thioester hydrolase